MKIRLYLDEDAIAEDLVRALLSRGVDLTTANLEGMIERDDRDHLDYAISQSRVLYSYNVGDYLALHSQYLQENKFHKGIILTQQQKYGIGEQMRRILRLIGALSAEEMENRLEFLSVWS
jgi:hypothetical protein